MEILPQDIVIVMLAVALLCVGIWSIFAPEIHPTTGQVIYTETDSRSDWQKAFDEIANRVPALSDDRILPTEKFKLIHAAYELERMD